MVKLPKIPNLSPVNLALIGGGVLALVAVVYVASRKATGDKRSASEMLGAAVAGAVANTAVNVGVGAVKGVGEAVGIPDTNTDKCAAAMAANSTWDASLYCTASQFATFLKNKITGGSATPSAPAASPDTDYGIRPTLRKGSTGNAVRELQGKLGITVDGIFGNDTDAAVRAFQAKVSLIVDGVVGPATWNALDVGYAVVDQNGILINGSDRDLIH